MITMASLDDTIILGEAKGSASRAEVAGRFEDLASIDERRVGVACRRGRDAREARGADPRRDQRPPSIWSDRRHIRPAGVSSSLFRVAHSHPDHHGVAPEHAAGALCAPARVGSRAAYIGLLDRRGGGRRSIVWHCGQPQRPGSELADRAAAVLPASRRSYVP